MNGDSDAASNADAVRAEHEALTEVSRIEERVSFDEAMKLLADVTAIAMRRLPDRAHARAMRELTAASKRRFPPAS